MNICYLSLIELSMMEDISFDELHNQTPAEDELLSKKLARDYYLLAQKLKNREMHISYLEDLVREQHIWIERLQEHTKVDEAFKNETPMINTIALLSNSQTEYKIGKELSFKEKIIAFEQSSIGKNIAGLVPRATEDNIYFEGCSGGRAKYMVRCKK